MLWLFAGALYLASFGKLIAAPAAPEISKVEPFVWVVGATNAITIEGKELAKVRGLWTSRHGVLEGKQLDAVLEDEGKQLKLSVPISGQEAPGPFAMRLLTDGGVSAPVMGVLEDIPQFSPGTSHPLSGTGHLSGVVDRDAGVRHRVKLRKGESIGIDIMAGRFGSKLDPVLRILDPYGRELVHLHDTPGMGVDCALDFKAASAGDYTLEIRDAGYGSGADFRYLLRMGAITADAVGFSVLGKSAAPQGKDSPASATHLTQALALENRPITVAVASERAFRPKYSGQRIQVHTSHPVVNAPVEFDAAKVPTGASLSSTFWWSAKSKHYLVEIGQRGLHRFVAHSRRIGGACDPAMRLKSADDSLLKESHLFRQESVIAHEFKEPGLYRLEVWDPANQFGMAAGFLIAITSDPTEFELNTETNALRIPAGGEGELNVTIDRDGYDGPVKFELAHGPEGVELADLVAKEKSKEAKFKVKLAGSLTPGTTFPLKISGRRGEGENAPKAPLYTSAYWKKRFPDLYSPMFEFEDTVWVTVLPPKE